jgi:hypothetical protein
VGDLDEAGDAGVAVERVDAAVKFVNLLELGHFVVGLDEALQAGAQRWRAWRAGFQ